MAVYENTANGDWVTVQFGTTGGTYLVGVNGESKAFIFDGTDFLPYDASDVSKLNYDTGTAPFTAGQTVTGRTSTATATIYKVVPSVVAGEGTLWLTDITGTFQNNEVLTDGVQRNCARQWHARACHRWYHVPCRNGLDHGGYGLCVGLSASCLLYSKE